MVYSYEKKTEDRDRDEVEEKEIQEMVFKRSWVFVEHAYNPAIREAEATKKGPTYLRIKCGKDAQADGLTGCVKLSWWRR